MGARCRLSRGREDCGRGDGIGLELPVCACRGCGCKYGGASWVCTVGSLGAERTVGGGLGWGWECLYVHVEAAGASKGGQAGCALWALLGPRGLWEGG